jgi:hypothetical protein
MKKEGLFLSGGGRRRATATAKKTARGDDVVRHGRGVGGRRSAPVTARRTLSGARSSRKLARRAAQLSRRSALARAAIGQHHQQGESALLRWR